MSLAFQSVASLASLARYLSANLCQLTFLSAICSQSSGSCPLIDRYLSAILRQLSAICPLFVRYLSAILCQLSAIRPLFVRYLSASCPLFNASCPLFSATCPLLVRDSLAADRYLSAICPLFSATCLLFVRYLSAISPPFFFIILLPFVPFSNPGSTAVLHHGISNKMNCRIMSDKRNPIP